MSRDLVHDFRLHRDNVTCQAGLLFPGHGSSYGEQFTIPYGPQQIQVTVRTGPHAPYASAIDIDGRRAFTWTAVPPADINEYQQIGFLFDGAWWLLEYRQRGQR